MAGGKEGISTILGHDLKFTDRFNEKELQMVYRVYVEKEKNFSNEAMALLSDINHFLQIINLEDIRIINRYDVENIDKDLFECAKSAVFSEPQVDQIYTNEPDFKNGIVFAAEYLPGQFDQRADSAEQCIQIISRGIRPTVKTAKIYVLYGNLQENEISKIKNYIINPVECQETSLERLSTLKFNHNPPENISEIEEFINLSKDELGEFILGNGLAMDIEDINLCQKYFKKENRNPTFTEIKVIDTYWSDHCRHTTFSTIIDSVSFEDPNIELTYKEYISMKKQTDISKPVSLMNVGTIVCRYLKNTGKLNTLDESDEINACTVKIDIEVDGGKEPWLLLFKNETHNHPTEIEPFGGAATCIGGAIRDPLSGRAYVYAAMRLTGAANPLKPISETIKGKLPQKKIVSSAADGYSSYGNQIGIATGIVDEIYHAGYEAKHMEIGAVIAAAPFKNVHRKPAKEGDAVILIGGKTGRDGCGGATGSSKSHTLKSLETCGAEVQKGNAPEERKIQRLFRNTEICKMIKKCNDFGAGGVAVAIGEIADGLEINLDKIPKKYSGLDGTELAISESQERMAAVVDQENVSEFLNLAHNENIEATVVAKITSNPYLEMFWNGKKIVNISREFLNSNGSEKHVSVIVEKPLPYKKEVFGSFTSLYEDLAGDLNVCSKKGLSEQFDSTIGSGTVLMPFGGKYQLTPIQAMVHKISVENGNTNDCSLMAWGYNPFIFEKSPYHGAYLAVVESVSKLIATGAEFKNIYLTFQEYFEKLNKDSKKWGKPFAALLGAFKAQKELQVAAIGGKDSMSGSFENLNVPPTLVSFAVKAEKTDNIISNEFKSAGNKVIIITPQYDENNLPIISSLIEIYSIVNSLIKKKTAVSAYTPTYGSAAEAIMKMSFGNKLGFKFSEDISLKDLFDYSYGSFILEINKEDISIGKTIGVITEEKTLNYKKENISLENLLKIYEDKLKSVYGAKIRPDNNTAANFSFDSKLTAKPKVKSSKPNVLIPVFPGTNCEYDSAKAVNDAGGQANILVINNLSSEDIEISINKFEKALKESQIIFIPGGFSGGDEPDGSAKFITAFFRNEIIKKEVNNFLENKDGLILGICNGFQALIKLGLVPFGKIIDADKNSPTLTFNKIGKHQSRIVRTRICSNKSPWLSMTNVGEIYNAPISHGEGRFIAPECVVESLKFSGQIATQYVDLDGNATMDIKFNPNSSIYAVEGITSPDGRIFGKMGHVERKGYGLYKNVFGNYDMKVFESAVNYFK
jgi:phosphoribosylformylglycinamidine synthase